MPTRKTAAWLGTICVMSVISSASAQSLTWHGSKHTTSGSAAGVSIRNWGPTGDTWLLINHTEVVATDDLDHETTLRHFTCDAAGAGKDYCEDTTFVDSEDVGSTINSDQAGSHSMHPALAIRKVGSEFEVGISRAEPEGTHSCADIGGDPVWDLVGYFYETDTASVTDELPIQTADDASDCRDHGITELKWNGGDLHACYTSISSTLEQVQCNDDAGTNWSTDSEWQDPVDYVVAPTLEDHPSFVLDGREVGHDAGRVCLEARHDTFVDGRLQLAFEPPPTLGDHVALTGDALSETQRP